MARVTVVTGAASGIGRAIAKRLAATGDFVVVADMNARAGPTVVENAGCLAVVTYLHHPGLGSVHPQRKLKA